MALYRDVAVDNAGDSGNEVTASPAKLHWIQVHNTHASTVAYVHLYKLAATDVTPGTTTPDLTIAVRPSEHTGQIMIDEMSQPGWTICASDAAAGSGSAVTAIVLSAKYG